MPRKCTARLSVRLAYHRRYCKLYKYLIIYFITVRCFRLRLIRNYKRIMVKKVTFS